MIAYIRDVLAHKGSEVVSIAVEASVFDAIHLMAQRHTGCLLAMSESGKLAGIVSERDCISKVVLPERSPRDVSVREIMSSKVQYVTPEQTTEEAMALMTHARIRHLPVMSGDQVAGLISIGDLVKHTISAQDLLIRNLEKYIEGTY